METFDVVIIGSGPAGVAAALALDGRRVLVVDVGTQAPPPMGLDGNLYDLRRTREDLFDELIGTSFESLRNLYEPPISLKLKSPAMSYIVRDAARLSPVRSQNFEAMMSFATGGLANAWGAGVFRFDARDLAGFPVAPSDLEPWYDLLTRHIGISGVNDDLTPSFGHDPSLQPPPGLSRFAADLLRNYQRHRAWFQRRGIAIGRPRLAVLTQPHRGREPYRYGNLEFFRPRDPAVYNPAFTLEELVASGRVVYARDRLALRYSESADFVEVVARSVSTGAYETFRGRALILAAGALNSAKLALASNGDHETRLPVMDNPMACLPIFRPGLIGKAIDARDSSIGQLVVVFEHKGVTVQGSIYGAAGPLRSDVLFNLPLSIPANLSWLRRLAAATGLAMLFYPSEPDPSNYLRLAPDGALEIVWQTAPPSGAEKFLIPAFRRIGFLTARALCQYPGMGAAIHYAGCLPMRENPGRYELYPDGLLFGTRRVYVADGACFPRLPAKNLTFTIMANAMRIASAIRS